MVQTRRPLSPHLQIYRWQVQMVVSIMHRATGIVLFAGSGLVVWGLTALATGPVAFGCFKTWMGSPPGLVVLVGWSWAWFYHLCSGIRHLVQDMGLGYTPRQFVRSGWLVVIVSVTGVILVWVYVLMGGEVP